MNGRTYDYNLGRLLSVDPYIQFPSNSQSLNPYSYIMNNPMSGTDPSGYAACKLEDDAASCLESGDNEILDNDGNFLGTLNKNNAGSKAQVSFAASSAGLTFQQNFLASYYNGANSTEGTNSKVDPTDVDSIGAISDRLENGTVEEVTGFSPIALGRTSEGEGTQAFINDFIPGVGTARNAAECGHGSCPSISEAAIDAGTDLLGGFVAKALSKIPGVKQFLEGVAKKTEDIVYNYRGVHAGHPALADARQGRIVPGDINGTITPEQHNAGGVSDISPFTSWTRSPREARKRALENGSGGVMVRVPVGAPTEGATWNWQWSPDIYGEQEVLMRGIRNHVEVLDP